MSDIMEISREEYEAIIGMSAKMAETIAAIHEENAVLKEAVKTMVNRQTDVLTEIRGLFDAMKITINVPELPAPVINNLPYTTAVKSRRYNLIRERGVIVGIEEVESE